MLNKYQITTNFCVDATSILSFNISCDTLNSRLLSTNVNISEKSFCLCLPLKMKWEIQVICECNFFCQFCQHINFIQLNAIFVFRNVSSSHLLNILLPIEGMEKKPKKKIHCEKLESSPTFQFYNFHNFISMLLPFNVFLYNLQSNGG